MQHSFSAVQMREESKSLHVDIVDFEGSSSLDLEIEDIREDDGFGAVVDGVVRIRSNKATVAEIEIRSCLSMTLDGKEIGAEF